MSEQEVGAPLGYGGREGAPAMRGSRAWVTWVIGALIVAVSLAVLGWVVLGDKSGGKKAKAVAAEPGKPNRWNVPSLEPPTPAGPTAGPKVPTVNSVQPGVLITGSGEVVLTVLGANLEGANSVAATGSGVFFREPDVSADGRRLTVRASVPATAQMGAYRLVVRTPTGDAKAAVTDVDRVLVEGPNAAKAPAWVPPLPERTVALADKPPAPVKPEKAAPGPAPAAGPGGKPPVDPTLARRLTAPIGSSGGGGGGAGAESGTGPGASEERGGTGGVDMGRTKIGVARARRLADLTMMIPAGTEIGCVLDNSIQTDQPGFVSCSVSTDVYGADGTVVLVDRGSQIIGEYRTTSISYGKERVFVVWSRVRTPTGVLVEIDSPGTGALGEAGFGGWVDNHYGERIGIPILMSVVTYGIQTAVAAGTANATGAGNGAGNTNNGYNQIGQATDNSLQGVMAEMAKIKPTLHKNQGDLVNVLVMKDLDMSPAYKLARTGE